MTLPRFRFGRSEDVRPAAVLAEGQDHGDLLLVVVAGSREVTRIGRRKSVGRKPIPLAKATARPLSVPTQ